MRWSLPFSWEIDWPRLVVEVRGASAAERKGTDSYMEVCKSRGPFLGVHMVGIIPYRGLFCGPLFTETLTLALGRIAIPCGAAFEQDLVLLLGHMYVVLVLQIAFIVHTSS